MSQIVYHPTFVFGITLVVIAICTTLFLNAREIKKSSELSTHLQSQVNQKKSELERLKIKADASKNPYNQESIVRDELVMQKSGEYLVQMPDLPQPIIDQTVIRKQRSPWEEWRQILNF